MTIDLSVLPTFDITSTELRRFATKVTANERGCWIWHGAKNSRGYGCLGLRKTPWLAHRLAYTMCVGPIPDGLTIDHMCAEKRCVNPAHLEPVTIRQNIQRSHLWSLPTQPEARIADIHRREERDAEDRVKILALLPEIMDELLRRQVALLQGRAS